MSFTEFDRQLLSLAQRSVPFVRRPFAALAQSLGSDQATVLARVTALRGGDAPVIREIAGVFEASALGYDSLLAAGAIAPQKLDAAGERVAGHPGVGHCYAREGRLNLWFTLTLGPDSTLGLARTAELLGRQIGAETLHCLPTLRRYKIGVHVGAHGRMDSSPGLATLAEPPPAQPLSDQQRSAIRVLQMELPCEPEPFATLARAAGLSEDRLLRIATELLEARVLRRYGAMLNHRRAGLAANVLVAWRVSPSAADAAGKAAANNPAVTHCYLRPTVPDWPYNLYTMIHGRSREECALVIDEIAATTSLTDHAALWTAKEFKKAKTLFFTDAVARWEAEQNNCGL